MVQKCAILVVKRVFPEEFDYLFYNFYEKVGPWSKFFTFWIKILKFNTTLFFNAELTYLLIIYLVEALLRRDLGL